MKSGGVDEDEFRIVLARDAEFGLVDGGDAVADRNPLPVDEDHALGRGEIGMPKPAERVRDGRPRQKSRAQNPRVGADLQRLCVLGVPTRECDQSSGAIGLREAAIVPARRSAALTRKQPNLEQLEGNLATIALGMTDPRPRANNLNVARYRTADVAGAVLMRDDALPDIGDDFHVGMRVTAEAGAWGDLVVVPDHQSAKRTICRVTVCRHYKMVACFKPSVIAAIERFLGSSRSIAVSRLRARWMFASGMVMEPKRRPISQQIEDSAFYHVNAAGPFLRDRRRFQRGGDEIDDGAHTGEHSSARRKDEMQDPLDCGPIRQHSDKSARGERFLAVHRRRQGDAGALARSGDQNIEAPRRKYGFDRDGVGVSAFRRKAPDTGTLRIRVERGEAEELVRRRRLTHAREQHRAGDEDPIAEADPLHLQLRIGVEPLADANGDVDPFMNEIDAPVCHDALQPESRMGREKPGQAGGDRGLESERTAHANEPPGLRLHPQRRLLGGFRFNYGGARMFKDLLSDLGQVHASGRAIEEPYAEPLFQHRHPATDARLGKPKRTCSSRETAMLDDSREELEVIKIPHRDLFRWGSAHSGGRPRVSF